MTEIFFRGYIRWVLRYATWVVAATTLISAFFALQLPKVYLELSQDALLPQQHEYVRTFNFVEKKFAQKDQVFISFKVKTGNVLEPAIIRMVGKITADIQTLPDVTRENVLSLTTSRTKDIFGTAQGLSVTRLVDPATPQAELLARIERNPMYEGLLVSADRKSTGMVVDFKRPEHTDYLGREARLRGLIEKHLLPGVEYGISGIPIQLAALTRYSLLLVRYFLLAVLIVGALHFYSFRTFQGLVLPLVTALMAVLWSTGLLGFLHYTLGIASATTPILLLAVAAGHAVQILKRYYEEYERSRDNRRAIEEAIVKVGPVMVLAGVIAALSFLSLLLSQIAEIRVFGLYCAIGIVSALVVEMTFTPALRALLPAKPQKPHRDFLTAGLEAVSRRILDARTCKAVVVSSVAIALLLGLCARQVKVDNRTKQLFPASDSFIRGDALINAHLAGTETMSIILEGPPDSMKRPELLRPLDRLQRLLEADPAVGKTISIADFIKKLNRAMHEDQVKYDVIPESQDLIAQYLLLYSMSGGPTDFDSYITNDYDVVNATVFLKTDSTARNEELIAKIREFAVSNFPTDIHIRFGGALPIVSALNSEIVHGKILNILQIFFMVFVLGGLVLRSALGGGLLTLPILMTVLFNFGLMGILGIPLDIGTSLVSALAVGVGVDYSLYFIFRLKEAMALNGNDWEKAMTGTLTTGGEGILLVAAAIALGYFSICLSPFGFHRNLGLLVGVSMLVSSLSSITLLPAALLLIKPRFILRAAASLKTHN